MGKMNAWLRNGKKKWLLLGGSLVLCLLIIAGLSAIVLKPTKKEAIINLERRAENVEKFYADCVNGILASQNAPIPETCRTAEAIYTHYDLDIRAHLNAEHEKLIMTARRVANGDIIGKDAYEACVARHECAVLPRLSRKSYKRDEMAYRRANLAFLKELGRGVPLNATTCSYMNLCRAIRKAGVLNRRKK